MAGVAAAVGAGLVSSVIDAATSLGVAGIHQKTALEVQARDIGFRRGIIREHTEALGKEGLPAFIAYGGNAHGLLEPYKVALATGSHVGRPSLINNSFNSNWNMYGNFRKASGSSAFRVSQK
ncbi:putative minor structural protein [Ameiurus nebulosus calicivirus 1]|nr:putative minor structural protein [Ameiurus nebulosus calicivirus 1]